MYMSLATSATCACGYVAPVASVLHAASHGVSRVWGANRSVRLHILFGKLVIGSVNRALAPTAAELRSKTCIN